MAKRKREDFAETAHRTVDATIIARSEHDDAAPVTVLRYDPKQHELVITPDPVHAPSKAR